MKVWIAIAVATVAVLILVGPSKDICADTVRGYKQSANASLEVVRVRLESLRGVLGQSGSLEVPPLPDLGSAEFSVLRACDTSCQLLARCLRFVFFQAPSAACPQEYEDLKRAEGRAGAVIARLNVLESGSEELEKQAKAIQKLRSEREELEQTTGATGNRLAIARENERRATVQGLQVLGAQIASAAEVLRALQE